MASKRLLFLAWCAVAFAASSRASDVSEEARASFDSGNYPRAIEILTRAAASSPGDSAVQYLLARSYYESEQFDKAISPAERAVKLAPGNSAYHELLGHAYGEKADRAGIFGGLSLAKKARKEFETAAQLDAKNFSAMQALIEFDCAAPGMAGGGEDKARPEIQRLRALDAAEGHYAEGNCRRQKKDYETADSEFQKALALHPSSADLIYDMGDHYMKHPSDGRLLLVVREGERVAPEDPRGDFFRAVAYAIEKEKSVESAKLLREYIARAPKRSNYPSKAMAHYWLGRVEENRNNAVSAREEYKEALNLEPKNHFANEALKRLQRN